MVYYAHEPNHANNKKKEKIMQKFDNVGTDREFQHLCQG